jgi:hypothetical protein
MLESVDENFDVNIVMKEFPADREFSLVNKLLVIDKKTKHKHQVLTTEEKLDDIGARLEHAPRKSLERLAEEIEVSKSSARSNTIAEVIQ